MNRAIRFIHQPTSRSQLASGVSVCLVLLYYIVVQFGLFSISIHQSKALHSTSRTGNKWQKCKGLDLNIFLLCTLSAKDRGPCTKNPVVDLELIHHFSRVLPLDYWLSTEYGTQPYFAHLNNHSKYGRPKVLKHAIYAPRSLPTVCILVWVNDFLQEQNLL